MSKRTYLSPGLEQYWTVVENVCMQSPGYGDAGAAGGQGGLDNDTEDY